METAQQLDRGPQIARGGLFYVAQTRRRYYMQADGIASSDDVRRRSCTRCESGPIHSSARVYAPPQVCIQKGGKEPLVQDASKPSSESLRSEQREMPKSTACAHMPVEKGTRMGADGVGSARYE